jgi:carboxyl-terminal processing protease
MKFRLIPALLLTACVARAQAPETKAIQAPVPPAESGLLSPATTLPEVSRGIPAETFLLSAKYTNAVTHLPGAEDGKIAQTFALLLSKAHYTRQRFDDDISARFFDRYLELWDPQKLFLLQSDFTEFVQLRTQLDDLTLRHGDTAPAYNIFNRFMLRFDQCYALVMHELQQGQFSFETDEQFVTNRKEEARPKDLDAARKLWRDRLRFEYLAEKLGAFNPVDLTPTLAKAIDAGKPGELATSLTNKLSVEKAGKLAELAKSKLEVDQLPKDKVIAALLVQLDQDRHEEIVKQLARRYNRTLRNLKQIEPDEVLQVWLDSLGHAYDPHTDYLGKRELDQFAISMNLSLFGIGATLQSEDGYTVIRSIVAGSPAEKSKQIKIGDKVVGVAQGDGDFADVIDEKLNKVVDQIRGAKGTKVRLQIIPEGADSSVRKVVAIVRDEIKLEDSEAKSKLIELPTDNGQFTRVGVIDLPSFYANFPVGGRRGSGKTTTGDVAKLVKKLTAEGARGLILDLRRNGGGSLEEAINLTGLFIKSGPVVQVRNYDGSVQVEEDTDESIAYDGPLMVLTSRFSASASEILAGALQDYGRALVVGDTSTHGKGTVQTVQELGNWLARFNQNPGAAKVTIRKFYRASGASTQLKGVAPDLVLPGVNNHLEVGEASLTNALPWDTIASAGYEKLNRIQPLLPELTRRSTERLSQDHDFNYVREDVERFKKRQAEKAVSMNESKRRGELAEDKARAEARKKELSARHEKSPKTYEITLKLADQEGLPAPVTNKVVVAVNRADARVLQADKKETSANTNPDPEADPDEPPAEGEEVASDVTLKEAGRILLDLIRLHGRSPATARVP